MEQRYHARRRWYHDFSGYHEYHPSISHRRRYNNIANTYDYYFSYIHNCHLDSSSDSYFEIEEQQFIEQSLGGCRCIEKK